MSFAVVSRGVGDLKTRYRPMRLDEMVATASLSRLKNIYTDTNASQIYLFEGLTGSGKTTASRILARAMICSSDTESKPCLECTACSEMENTPDFTEINAANFRKIDDIRSLVEGMKYAPVVLSKKIYILDEVHQLTDSSQQLLLKELEDPPSDIVVFMCTTERKGLKRTLIDRATTIPFNAIKKKQANDLIDQVLLTEQTTIPEELRQSVIEKAKGSVRALLNNLQAVLQGSTEFTSSVEEWPPEVPTLVNALLKKDWKKATQVLKTQKVKDTAESIRIGSESYLRAIVLKQSSPNAAMFAARPLGLLAGTLSNEPSVSQYNQLVLKCLRICYKE